MKKRDGKTVLNISRGIRMIDIWRDDKKDRGEGLKSEEREGDQERMTQQ